MFATILRRWRLVTPLALAVLTISVVAGGVIMPASAHKAKFHFFGRAFALADDSTVLPDTACDTGFIARVGSASLDTGHCFGVDAQGEPGAAITGSGNLESIFSDATVVSSHGNTKGKVLAKVDMEEAAGAHARDQQGCQANFAPVGTTRTETSCGGFIVFPNGQCAFGNDANQISVTFGTATQTFPAQLTFPCPAHPSFSLLDDSFGNQQVGDAIFWADLITVAAEAECHTRLNGTTHASVASAIELSDAAVREDNRLRFIGPQGSVGNAGEANTTFTISGFTDGQEVVRDIVVIINERHVVEDGDSAAVSVNAIHLVGTNDDGRVQFNFILGHAFAGIHCARHLDGQDTLTIPGA